MNIPCQQEMVLNLDPKLERRKLRSQVLLAAGFDVIEVESAQQSQNHLKNHAVSVAMVSSCLAGYVDFCLDWKRNPDTALIPLLLVADAQQPIEQPDEIADGYLLEPVASAELLAYIRLLLRLARSEARFTAIAETFDDVIWISDPTKQQLIYVSPGFTKIWGCDVQELYARFATWLDAVHIDDRERVMHRFYTDVVKGTYDEEYRIVRPDGSMRWVRDRGKPMGLGPLMFGIAEDITERKATEERLQVDLNDAKLLQRVSTEIFQSEDFQAVLEKIMDAAASIMHSDFASIQMLYPERGDLRLLASHGFDIADATFGEWMNIVSCCTCGMAMRTGQRAIATDLRTCEFLAGSADQAKALQLGILAMLSTPLFSRGGKLVGMISTHWKLPHIPTDHELRLLDILACQAADLIERRLIEEALRSSERRFRAIFNQQFQYSALLTPKAQIIEISDSVYRGTGIPRAEVIDTPILDAPWWRDLPKIQTRLQQQIREALDRRPISSRAEIIYRTKDGSLNHALNTVTTLCDEDDNVEYLLFEGIDITEIKLANEALRESEERFRTLTQLVPSLIWETDAEGNSTFVSESWISATGISFDQALDSRWISTIHPEDHERVIRQWSESVSSSAFYEITYRIREKDGNYRWYLEQAKPQVDTKGKVVRWIGSSTNIHQLVEAQIALKEADQHKSEFLATLAHELRNPLAPIRAGLQVLAKQRDDQAETKQLFAIMDRQANHLTRLVDDLLEISRISQGKISLKKERIDLAEIIRHSVELNQSNFHSAGHQLTVMLPFEPIVFEADPIRITQVLFNILNNATKYTEAGGHIDIHAQCDANEITISVRDNGVGISTEMLPRVFDLFAQVDRTLGRAQGGLGIGLALARHLIEMHGGRIEAHSQGERQGSEFIIYLPCCINDSYVTEVNAMEHPSVDSTNKRHILVIDDNQDVANAHAMLLNSFGADARAAYGGHSGLKLLAEFKPDVILLDLGMPDMDGYETARQIRLHPNGQHVRLIALTGWGQEDVRRRTREAGFDDHLIKPADMVQLKQLIEFSDNQR